MSGQKIIQGLKEALEHVQNEQHLFMKGVDESRRVLCRRMREHGFQTEGCNGMTVVCGWCDNTLRQMDDAIMNAIRKGGNNG